MVRNIFLKEKPDESPLEDLSREFLCSTEQYKFHRNYWVFQKFTLLQKKIEIPLQFSVGIRQISSKQFRTPSKPWLICTLVEILSYPQRCPPYYEFSK